MTLSDREEAKSRTPTVPTKRTLLLTLPRSQVSNEEGSGNWAPSVVIKNHGHEGREIRVSRG